MLLEDFRQPTDDNWTGKRGSKRGLKRAVVLFFLGRWCIRLFGCGFHDSPSAMLTLHPNIGTRLCLDSFFWRDPRPGLAVPRKSRARTRFRGLHASLEALGFHPRGGGGLRVNVSLKSRTRTLFV